MRARLDRQGLTFPALIASTCRRHDNTDYSAGGTVVAAVGALQDWGLPLSAIKVVSIIASMPGLERVLRELPGLEVFVGAADASLDKRCVAINLTRLNSPVASSCPA